MGCEFVRLDDHRLMRTRTHCGHQPSTMNTVLSWTAMRDNRLVCFREWLRDAPIVAGLWLLDRISGPYPETEADKVWERREARLGRAFPGVDIDGTGNHEP